MYLSDRDLIDLALNHQLITPFNEAQCEGATINISLDSQIKRQVKSEKIILGSKVPDDFYETINITDTTFSLSPGESILAQSYESFNIPTNMVAVIFEKYSIKLLGLVVSPASYMNPGYKGRLSFLITNHSKSPIQLVAGHKFCQLAIAELTSESIKPYNKQDGNYMGSKDVHISKMHLNNDIQEYMVENGLGEISSSTASVLGKHLIERIEKNAVRYAALIKEKLGESK